MPNSMRDYTPGVGSYKTEEGGSIRGISASDNVDHQMGTLTFSRQDISIDAPGPRLALSSRFNSDHLYASIIKQIASGTQPIKTLMTVPEGATCFCRISHGWSWDLPCIRVGVNNVFKVTFGGSTFDLSSLLTSAVLEQASNEIWLDGYHLIQDPYHDTHYKHLTIAIMETKAIVECEVLRSGTSPDYDYQVVNTATAPGTVLKLYAADGTLTTFDGTTGFIKSVTDPAGKNTLAYTFMDSPSSFVGTVATSPEPTRSQFAIDSADFAVLKPGDLITVRDNTRVVWAKKNGTTISLSGGLDFLPVGGTDTYIIGSARLSKISHTDGRAVKFYYYGRGNDSYIVTLLSSDANREHLNVGDIFLNRYTVDTRNRLVKFEVLETVVDGQPVDTFDTGATRLGQVDDSVYFIPLQHNQYVYSLTSEPDPSTDQIVVMNHAGAPTTYSFQKGGFRAHSYNQKNIFTGVVRKGTTTSLTLEKPDNILKAGFYIGLSRPNYKTAVYREPTDEDRESSTTVWDPKYEKVVDHYDAASDFVTVSALQGTNKFKLADPLTVNPSKGDECLVVDNSFVRSEKTTTKDSSDAKPLRVYIDTAGVVVGDFLAIRNEVRRISAKGTAGGATYVDVDHRFSFVPNYTTGAESVLLIKGDAGTNDFFVYYLNKPKVVKVTHKQSYDDPKWRALGYAYVYLKGGNETRDDFNGGGFIYGDVDGPTSIKMAPDDIELVKTLVYTFEEASDRAEDYTQSVFTFQYDDRKRIMGEKEQKLYRREGASWVPVRMTVNVLGHPCTRSEFYGITSSYDYRNTCEYHDTAGVPDDLNWKTYVDNDYDGWGRLVRSRKYADCLPGGQAITSWTQYVGIGTTNEELDPYAKFWGNKYAVDYQDVFDARKCFEVVGATISKVNSEGLYSDVNHKYNELLNIVETEVIESTLLSSNDVVYTDVEFRAVDGETIIDDPAQIYWSIDDSEPQNVWSNARFAYSNQYYAYSSRSLITQYEYDETNNKLIRITRPEGNVIELFLGTDWMASYVVKDKVEFDDNLEEESQFRIDDFDYDLKGRLIQKSTYMVEDDGSTPYTGDGAFPRAIQEFDYDGMDRVTMKRGGDSSTTEVLLQAYDDDNRVMTVTDFIGNRTKTWFDGLFRPIETASFKPDSDAQSNLTHDESHDVRVARTMTTYDVMSGKSFESTRFTNDDDAGEHRCIARTSYDKLGRVVRTELKNTDADYAGSATFDVVSAQEYLDEENAVITRAFLSDQAEAAEFVQSKVENDWLGRGVSRESSWTGKNGTGGARTVQYFYDYAGNQVKMRLPSDEEYRRLFNSSGKLEKVSYPDGTFSLVNYDKNGRITRALDRRLAEVSSSFNKADLLKEVVSTDPTYGAISRKTCHSHLGPASFLETQDEVEIVNEEYEYHWTASPTLVRQSADATMRELVSSYDAAGNPLSLGVNSPTGQAWSKTVKIDAQYHPSTPDLDHVNRIMIGTDETPSRRILTQESDYLGLLAGLKFADGAGSDVSELSLSYDKFLRLRRIASNDDELNVNLQKDFMGNLLNRKEPADGSAVDASYSYDGMGRLLTEEGQRLTYDELSNISSRDTRTYTYQETQPDANRMRLASFFDGSTTFSYSYDANGNVTAVSDRFAELSYDNLNRLRQVEHEGGQIDRYWYNERGLRFKREEAAEGETPQRTYTMYIGEVPVMQEKYEGAVKTESRFNLTVAMGGDPRTAAQLRKVYGGAETLLFFYVDQLGSRRVVLDSEGTVLDRFEYSPWGEMTHLEGTQDELAAFTGKEYDATGLLYFNARYYDPTIGRFLTEDPSRKGTGWYTYCSDNPLNRTDPTGRYDPDDPERTTAAQTAQASQPVATPTTTAQPSAPTTQTASQPTSAPTPTVAQRVGNWFRQGVQDTRNWISQNVPKISVGVTGDILGYNFSATIEADPRKGFRGYTGQSFTALSLAGISIDLTVGEPGATEITVGANRWMYSFGANLGDRNNLVGLSAHMGAGASTGITATGGGDDSNWQFTGEKAP